MARRVQGGVDRRLGRIERSDFLLAWPARDICRDARRRGRAAGDFDAHMRQRVDGRAVEVIFEMEMRAGRETGIARQPDRLAFDDRRARRNVRGYFGEMRIGRLESVMLDADMI